MTKLKIAVAGAGAISEFHLKGWQAQTDVELCAICDPDSDRAAARAAEFGIPRTFTDVEEMLRESRAFHSEERLRIKIMDRKPKFPGLKI